MMKKKQKKMSREQIYKMIDDKTKVISHPSTIYKTVTFICAGFPEKSFKEWKEACSTFNDMYWAKIWNDHIKAQAYDTIIAGGVQYVKEENNTANEQKETKENESEPVVFGDGE